MTGARASTRAPIFLSLNHGPLFYDSYDATSSPPRTFARSVRRAYRVRNAAPTQDPLIRDSRDNDTHNVEACVDTYHIEAFKGARKGRRKAHPRHGP